MLATAIAACSANALSAAPAANALSALSPGSSSGDLLYIGAKNHIDMLTYPGASPVGTITTKFRLVALCSDAKGNVFVPGVQGAEKQLTGVVYEYTHGGTTPTQTIALPKLQLPVDCSRDPSSGALAVTSYDAHNFKPQIDVYLNGKQTPKTYTNSALGAAPAPAYDDAGDLYVTSGGNVGVELSSGSSTLVKITSNVVLGGVAHAQWDGKYFALQSFTVARHQGENTPERVYRLSISGANGTLEGYSRFLGWLEHDAGRSWIAGTTIVAAVGKYASIYHYPAGGKRTKIVRPANPGTAVTVSVAP